MTVQENMKQKLETANVGHDLGHLPGVRAFMMDQPVNIEILKEQIYWLHCEAERLREILTANGISDAHVEDQV